MKVLATEEANVKYNVYHILLAGALFLVVWLPADTGSPYIPAVGTAVFGIITFCVVRSYIMTLFALPPGAGVKSIPQQWPRVSVIIASYNEEAVLPRTIPTLLMQDYPADKLELLYVYEAACTDRTESIIQAAARQNSRIIPLRHPVGKQGKAAAVNYGIAHATGDIIAIFDSDHSLNPDVVRRAVTVLQQPKVMCVRGRCRTINAEENLITRLVSLERDMVERLDIYGAWRFGGFSTFTGGHAFFRRKVFDEVGLFDEDILVEDIDMSVKLHAAGYEIAVAPGVQSWEEAPTSWKSLLHQRKRWTRGWIQIWRRHAPSILWQRKAKLLKRIDVLVSLTCSVIAGPLIALVPLLLLSVLGMHTSYIPSAIAFKLWLFVVTAPSIMALITWLLDKDEAKRADWHNLLLSPLLVPYTVFMFGVSWICLMDEFVLDWPFGYVKTPRAADLSRGDGRKMSPETTYDPSEAVTCLNGSVDKRRMAAAEP